MRYQRAIIHSQGNQREVRKTSKKDYQNMTEGEKNELIAYTAAIQKLCLDSIEKLMKSHSLLLVMSWINLTFLAFILIVIISRI